VWLDLRDRFPGLDRRVDVIVDRFDDIATVTAIRELAAREPGVLAVSMAPRSEAKSAVVWAILRARQADRTARPDHDQGVVDGCRALARGASCQRDGRVVRPAPRWPRDRKVERTRVRTPPDRPDARLQRTGSNRASGDDDARRLPRTTAPPAVSARSIPAVAAGVEIASVAASLRLLATADA
jgi:hypothetical protein